MGLALALVAALCQVLRSTVMKGTAYLMTLSSYVEAVKQVEILFALAIGMIVFGERQKVREISPGALVMLAGVAMLSLAS